MSAKQPVISVVVPTKGRLSSLERCLEALRGTEFSRERFEVVVANDRGGEQVESLVGSFDDALQVAVVMPRRPGPSAARNAGVAAARGTYVAFTDDDCEPAPGWLSALEESLEEHPGAAVGGRVLNGVPGSRGAAASQIVVDALQAQWNRSPQAPRFFPSSNAAFPADPLRAIGGFDEGFRYAEDRELCERWVRSGRRFVYGPEAIVVHMRPLGLREFVVQQYGYGRGAYAFGRTVNRHERLGRRAGVLARLAREALQPSEGSGRPAIAAYLALSQLATATGFAREAVMTGAARSRPQRAQAGA